jgi:hypothetical protein
MNLDPTMVDAAMMIVMFILLLVCLGFIIHQARR